MTVKDINNQNCRNTLLSDECGITCSKFGGGGFTRCPASNISVRKFMQEYGLDELQKYIQRLRLEDLLEDK